MSRRLYRAVMIYTDQSTGNVEKIVRGPYSRKKNAKAVAAWWTRASDCSPTEAYVEACEPKWRRV